MDASFWLYPAEALVSWVEILFQANLHYQYRYVVVGFVALVIWLHVFKAVVAIVQKLLGFRSQERQR